MIPDMKKYHKYFFLLIFIGLAVLSFLLVQPFIIYIISALFLVYLFFPLHKRLRKIVKSDNLSAWVMILIALVIIILPLVLVLNSLVSEVIALYNNLDFSGIASFLSEYIPESLELQLSEIFSKTFGVLAGSISGFLLSIPQKVLGFIIIVFVMFFGFRGGDKLVQDFRKILPLDRKDKAKIFNKVAKTMHGVIYGSIVIAVLQGFFAGIGFWIFGVPSPFLWGLIVAIAGMLPFIGPNTVVVPVVVYLGFTSSWAMAGGLLVYSLVILTLVLDFFLKAKVTSDKAEIHPLVAFLGVLGGLAVFGLPGLFLGPIILALFLLFIRIYSKRTI